MSGLEFAGLIALILVAAGIIFWAGYSAGVSDTNEKILERQHQTEAAEKWKDVLEKLSQGGAL